MRIFTFITIILFCLSANAADRYEFDKRHTSIIFFCSHMGFSASTGQFMDFDGFFELDEVTPENSKVEVVIKMDSVRTGLPKFDDHLKSKDFFNVDLYPEAKFVSTKVDLIDEKTAKVHGKLTMLDKTKTLTLDVSLNKIANNPRSNKKTAGFSIETKFKRSIWGLNYGIPMVGDEVKVLIEAEGPILDNNENKDQN